MLALCHQQTNTALSEHYFQRARQAVWLSQAPDGLVPGVSALSVSDHFAKWHYLNYHQHVAGGFRDAGRQRARLHPHRETIQISDSDTYLQRCVNEAKNRLAPISGAIASSCGMLFLLAYPFICFACCDQWMI
jgi:hypothetical protein